MPLGSRVVGSDSRYRRWGELNPCPQRGAALRSPSRGKLPEGPSVFPKVADYNEAGFTLLSPAHRLPRFREAGLGTGDQELLC